MTAVLDPIVSEFETEEQEQAHTDWLCAELERRSAIQQELIPHDQVMAEMRALMAAKKFT